MAKNIDITDVLDRARRAQEARLAVIESLAQAQHSVSVAQEERAERIATVERETTEIIKEAERAHVTEYTAAKRAGWTPEELKKLGFSEPGKITRTRKSTTRRQTEKPTEQQQQNEQENHHY